MSRLNESGTGSQFTKATTLSERGVLTFRSRKHRISLIAVVVTAALAVIAVALGLGVGLKRVNGASSLPSTSPSPSASTTPLPLGTPLPGSGGSPASSSHLEEWRLDPNSYILDTSWDLKAAPKTRSYDLVITEGRGWPDGELRDTRVFFSPEMFCLQCRLRCRARYAFHQREVPWSAHRNQQG